MIQTAIVRGWKKSNIIISTIFINNNMFFQAKGKPSVIMQKKQAFGYIYIYFERWNTWNTFLSSAPFHLFLLGCGYCKIGMLC